MKSHRERGAAMVEFAIIAPVLILLVLGLIEYGIRFSRQAEFNNAAFIAARSLATHQSLSEAKANAVAAGLPSSVAITGSSNCTAGTDVTVTISASQPSPTGFFGGSTYTVNAKGVARCDG